MSDQIAPPVGGEDSIVGKLAAGFANLDSQVDNSEPDIPIASEPVEDVPEETPEEEKPTEQPEEQPDTPQEDAEEPEEDEPEFNDLEEREFLTADQLKEKYARNAPKALITEAARYSTEAKAGYELKAKLGGEPFIEPIVDIAEGLQAEELDLGKIYTGISKAKGDDALVRLVAHSVLTSFTTPDDTPFGKSMKLIADAAIKEKFGDGASVDELKTMTAWKNAGWFEQIDNWMSAEEPDIDEVFAKIQELRELNNNPRLKAISAELADVKRQLEQQNAQAKSAETVKSREIDNTFISTVQGSIETVLTGIVWKNSPLKTLATDKPEVADEKEFLRNSLQEKAINHFNRSQARLKLVEGYRQRRENTAAWKKELSDAVNASVLSTKDDTAKAERLIGNIYSTSRNGQLTPKQNGQQPPPAKLEPTATLPVTPQPRTEKDVLDRLTAGFSGSL